MSKNIYNFIGEIRDFQLADMDPFIRSSSMEGVPFGVYTSEKPCVYYLHDEELNRLFSFKEKFGRAIRFRSDLKSIVVNYYLQFPSN